MQTATFTLYTSQLFFDLDIRTHQRTEATLGVQNPTAPDALTTDHFKPVDKVLLTRYLNKWDAALRERLKFCLVQDTTTSTLSYDNNFTEKESYVYDVNVSDEFNAVNMTSIGGDIHEYLTRGCLYDWYLYSGIQPTDTPDAINALADSIVAGLRGRSYGKRPIQPYGPGPDAYEF